jgi:hypothetical protein
MRRAKLAMLVPVLTAIAVMVPAAAAEATTYTCYPNTPFAFTIGHSVAVSRQQTATIPDGTPIPGGYRAQSDAPYYPTVTAGYLVDSYTNGNTGKTIFRNDSATYWFTYDPKPTVLGALATGTYINLGPNGQEFGPLSEAALQAAGINEPALVFTNGLLVMHFVVTETGTYVTSFALNGTQENGCAALAG